MIRSARTGRPSTRDRVYKPGELVRCDTRIPAHLAQQLYDSAHETGRPIRVVIADLLAKALDDVDEVPMA
ncbi:mechanosensitive ion channel protein MscS [Sanguibacter sp. 25GB23B1]|uniref:mechanosensitive ion channel protein MscS n=1 Tax=unclassified Sanguibacter TaxID=2645534 RepID=UPI0032AF0E80